MSLPAYPKYKNSGAAWLSKVPEHWEIKRLKRLIEDGSSISYGIVQPGEPQDEGVPFIQTTNMSSGAFGVDSLQKTTTDIAKAYPRSQLYGGEVILGIRASIGAAYVVPDHLHGANLSRGVARIACGRQISPTYLVLFFRSGSAATYWQLSKQGSTFNEVSIETVREIAVAVPPGEEQSAITAFLDREAGKIDELVREQERLVELLKEKRQAVISHAVTKGLNPDAPMKDSGIESVGSIPAHWQLVKLSRLIQPGRRITYGIVQPGERDEQGRFMVRGQDYSSGWAEPDSIFKVSDAVEVPYKRARLKWGDLVITIVGAGVGNVGMVPNWLDGANITQTTARIAIDGFKADPAFIAAVLQGPIGKRSVELYVKGAAQPGLNLEHLRIFPIPVPPLIEQHKIAEFILNQTVNLDELAASAEHAIDLLRERRIALISAAVTGKIDVRQAVGEVVA